MKKFLSLSLVLCLLFCGLLCGCKKNGEVRLKDVHYDNAPISAYAYEVIGDHAVITGFNAENTVANIPSKLDGKPVTVVRTGAFKDNNTLDTINLAPSVTMVEKGAFTGCTKLRSVSLPSALTSIGDEAFTGCTALVSVSFPPELTHIGARAFAGCSALETIAFPEKAAYIGAGAFSNTPWLTKQSREFVVECGTLIEYKGSLETVTVPTGVVVVSAAFSGNKTVKKVVLPNTVETVATDAFAGCTSLESVALGDHLKTVEDAAFSDCTALTEITFPKTIKTIDENAFAGCTALATIRGKAGSAAESFAKKHDLAFKKV